MPEQELLRALVDLSRSTAIEQGDLAGAIRQITSAAARTLGVERTSVWFTNDERTEIRCADLYELTPDRHSAGTRLSAPDFPAYFRALETERSIDASDAREDPRTREFTESYLVPLGITSMLDAPIREGGRLLGVVCQEHVGPARVWTAGERAFSGSVADFVVLAVETSRRRTLEAQYLQAQKMEAIGRLAAGVAHDFNTLLMVIRGFGDLASAGIGPEHPAQGHLKEIRDAADRAAALVRQLLAFSRRQVLAPRVISLNQVLEGMRRLLSGAIGEDVELTLKLAPDLWPVRADPGQIEQVVLNLAVNARDAMPAGGSLTLETRNVDSSVRLEVRDTGTGMTPDVLARLFEPFFTTKEPGKGTGLGLATCYGIIEQSGGHIKAESRPGEGSVFRIDLPRAVETAEAIREASAPAESGGRESLLVVEDDRPLRDLMGRALAGLGYRVVTAADGEEALQKAPPQLDLLVTDVVMPRLGGVELARRLREHRPDLRVLFASGYASAPPPLEGASEFFAKPISPAELARRIRQMLDAP